MSRIDDLPVPDWGLKCPGCGAALAGAPSHRCAECGCPFDIRRLISQARPIPDVGLTCPECEYSLTGLTESRCPECGQEFTIADLLEEEEPSVEEVDPEKVDTAGDQHTTQRAPTFTGRERPLPDFGLLCQECEEPLAGAEADRCPHCGDPFDLFTGLDALSWMLVRDFVPNHLADEGRTVLYQADVPYIIGNVPLSSLYPGLSRSFSRDLMVPREFYFDALHALAEAGKPATEGSQGPWTCPACKEDVPAGFEICWNCGESHPLANGAAGEKEVSE